MNDDLFASPEEMEEQRIEDCKQFLINKGYRVEDPPDRLKFNIKTLDELIEFFYGRMSLKHKELKFISRRKVMDRKIMSEFVKSRMNKGISRERAMDECAEMIDILFEHEEKFNFKYPVLSVGILGQRNLAWVTEKLEDFLLRQRIKARLEQRRAFNRELEKKYDIEIKEEFLTKEEELRKLLEEMEKADGKD